MWLITDPVGARGRRPAGRRRLAAWGLYGVVCAGLAGVTACTAAGAPIRGAQLIDVRLDGDHLEQLFAGLEQARVNTVILRVFEEGGAPAKTGVYFRTSWAPVLEDRLAPILAAAHRRGMHVYAWMTTMVQPWLLPRHPSWAVLAYDYRSHAYVPMDGRRPIWHGTSGWSYGAKVSIFIEEHRRLLERLYLDLAQYAIDGILLQDDLGFSDQEDYHPAARAAFHGHFARPLDPLAMFDRNGEPTPALWEWQRWKAERLLAYAGELMAAVHRHRPGLPFLLNVSWETVREPGVGLRYSAQDLDLAREFGFSRFALMAYHRDMAAARGLSLEAAVAELATLTGEAARRLGGPDRVLVKLHLLDWAAGDRARQGTGQPLPGAEVERAVRAVLMGGGRHIAYFPHRSDLPLATLGQAFAPEAEPSVAR